MKFSEPRRLTHLHAEFTSAAFSPDGRRVAFACVKERRCAVYLVDRDGADLTLLAVRGNRVDDSFWDLQFSPDGERLLCALSEGDGMTSDLCLIDVATGRLDRLTHGGRSTRPRFSPDGRHAIFESEDESGYPDICRVSAERADDASGGREDGRTVTFLTHDGAGAAQAHAPDGRTPPARRWGVRPAYSPDGRHIAFGSIPPTDDPACPPPKGDPLSTVADHRPHQIWVMRADGSDATCVTDERGECASPIWHPGGRRIAFTVRTDLGGAAGRKLWRYRTNPHLVEIGVGADGAAAASAAGPTRRLEGGDSVNHLGGFSPDGRFLVYASSCGERFPEQGPRNWDIRLLDTETGGTFAVTDNDWYDAAPVFSPDGGSILFVSARGDDGADGADGEDLYLTNIIVDG